MDPKTGRYIVNGAHESSKLQDLLDGFIKNFVLCEQCENPETALVSYTHTQMRVDGTIVYSRSEVANVCLRNSGFVQATDSRQGPF